MRYCLRSLRRSALFAAVSILILTVAIGSVLAAFSILDALLLRPLDVENPDQLVKISLVAKNGHLLEIPSSGLEILNADRTLTGVCGFDTSRSGVEIDRDIEPLGVSGYTGDCFRTLGLRVQIGRPLTSADNHPGMAGVAVISDSLWHSAYGGRADVLGKSLKISSHFYTIVGVAQRRFRGLTLGFPEDVIIPLLQHQSQMPNGKPWTWYWVSVLARRAPGISEAQARASLLAKKKPLLEETVPSDFNAADRKEYLTREVAVQSGRTGIDYYLRRRFGEPVYAIFGTCLAMLLIGCVNLTSLLLARSLNRRHEVSVRLALGASRTQIAALFTLETTILVFAGAVAGSAVGFWLAQTVVSAGAAIFGSFYLDVGPSSRILIFLAALVAVVLAIFSISAMWQARRLAKSDALKESGRGVIATNNFAQKILIGMQLALTLAFVSTSTLFATSLKNMYGIDFGIDTRNLWEVEVAGRRNNFDPQTIYRRLLQQIESLPEVQSASLSGVIPFYSYDYREPVAMIENGQRKSDLRARQIPITDRFFVTLGAKIVAGEDFRRYQNNAVEPPVIVSESLARYFGTARDVIGRHLKIGNQAENQRLRIVGVASDADLNLANLDDTKPFTVYFNIWRDHNALGRPVLLVRTRGGALPIARLREIVHQNGYSYIDRAAAIDAEIDDALVENRVLAYLSEVFSTLALLMAAVGLFGLLSYQVSNRSGEIGVRMALGAQRSQIQWLVLGPVVRLLFFGSIAGFALTLAIGRLITALFYRVTQHDAMPVVISAFILCATALAASWIPVRRASAVDPLVALRHE